MSQHVTNIGLPWAVITTKWFVCLFAEVLPIEVKLITYVFLKQNLIILLFGYFLTLLYVVCTQLIYSLV